MEGAVSSSSGAVGIDDAGEILEGETASRKRQRESSSSPAVDCISTVIFS